MAGAAQEQPLNQTKLLAKLIYMAGANQEQRQSGAEDQTAPLRQRPPPRTRLRAH